MDEVENDDLMQNSDEEWMTENEEPCMPSEKQFFIPNESQSTSVRSKMRFMGIGLLLIISSTFLLISLPLYLETVNIKGDAYTMVLFTSTTVTIILFILTFIWKKCLKRNEQFKIFKPPIGLCSLLNIGFILTLSYLLVIYAIDRKRVMCHLQDPMKGIILVFSLVFYFFFCRKLMGLQRIFSCTTIIVGLFISVDYGLCDEFRCRGVERATREEDAGDWTNRTHALWAAIYVTGLALFSAYFTTLERCLVPVCTQTLMYTSISSSFLATVSRLVASNDTVPLTSPTPRINQMNIQKKHSALSLTLWIHAVAWVFVIILFWVDIIPDVGKSGTVNDFWNYTTNGIACHFEFPFKPTALKPHIIHGVHPTSQNDCGNVSMSAWPFVFAYIIFSVSSIYFLILSQSAVFTVAMITVALPVSEIWWSLFQMTEIGQGMLIWSPSVTGELICSLLGLPIVLLGIALLCKSHFKEIAELEANALNENTNTDHEYSSASTRLA